MTRPSRAVAAVLSAVLVCAMGASARAFLKLGVSVGTEVVGLRWSAGAIRYYVTDRDIPGVEADQLRDAVERAARSWEAVPSASVDLEFAGFVAPTDEIEDGVVTVGFQDRPDLDRVLGTTSLVVDVVTGTIVEADVVLNSAFAWATAAAGIPGRYDAESIVLHELGHLLGLGHSLLGETEVTAGSRRVIAAEAAMFPIVFSPGLTVGRALRADDRAGLSDLYPGPSAAVQGSIRGRVTKNGAGVFGAHVVAFQPNTGELVGGFTLSESGDFVLAGLSAGPHVIRVEPLDDAAIDGFFPDPRQVDVEFAVTYFDRPVFVPRGGSAGPVEIAVRAR